MKTPYYIINMNLPNFTVPATLNQKGPSQQEVNQFRVAVDAWKKLSEDEQKTTPKPVAPETRFITNAEVCCDIMTAALQMAVPEGSPDTLRKLTKFHDAMTEALNDGQLMLSVDHYRFLQSKFAKADKWNTNPDVCKTVIAVQDAISRACFVGEKKA
jgi:hypothetical protein